MILNIVNNGKILKDNLGIKINDFTVLTGENGSGKTQLLDFIYNYTNENNEYDPNINYDEEKEMRATIYPLTNDLNKPLNEIIYSYPGLKTDGGDDFSPSSLIEIIKREWEYFEPFIWAYNGIRNKNFPSFQTELKELNSALSKMVLNGVTQQTTPIVPKVINASHLSNLKRIANICGKGIQDLNMIDYIIFYQIPLNIFSAALDLLFHQFCLMDKYYPSLTKGVIPPWTVFNQILDLAKFKYTAEYSISTDEEFTLPVKLVDRYNGKTIDFHNLSSGETTIVMLIFALYNSSNKGHFPQVILFDEPDAHLHPSLTQIFLDVIENVLVKTHNVKVILTTHSPSTVALAPVESIYCMDRMLGLPVKQDKRTAINTLSNGITSVTIEESTLGIIYNIKQENKHILFTEGITDKINLEIAWEKLFPNKKMNFYIQDCFSAQFLGLLFNQGDQADGVFNQFGKLKMIALFDFDSGGYPQWNNNKKFSEILEVNPRKGLVRSNKKNGYLMLLPVPEIDDIKKQVISEGNNSYKDKSYLTIELLLFDIPELKNYFKTLALPGGGFANVFNDNKSKRDFSKSLNQLDSSAFTHFKPLFEKVEDLLNN